MVPRELISQADLHTLEEQVYAALRSGADDGLGVLGYGEISLVLGWPPADPDVACKRLPVFPDRSRYEAYASAIEDYVHVLRDLGVDVVETEVRSVDRRDGIAAYAVQPALPGETLGVNVLAGADPNVGHPMVGAVVDSVVAAVGPTVGLDSQISNWAWVDQGLRYLDVTTPIMWTDGRARVDVDLLTRSLPWVLRGGVKRFVVPGLLDRYRTPRLVLVDLCANLIKERLDPWMPVFIDAIGDAVEPRITEEECRKYYRSDARLWEVMLRVRRLDRAWQLRVRRRPYAFLLPKQIER